MLTFCDNMHADTHSLLLNDNRNGREMVKVAMCTNVCYVIVGVRSATM